MEGNDYDEYEKITGWEKYSDVLYRAPVTEGIKEVLSLVDKYELNATFMTLNDFYLYKEDIKDNVQTEYEKRFHELGFPIYKVVVKK